MKPVYNPINPSFKWAQAFDFPEGWIAAEDEARMDFRQTPLSSYIIASASSETGGIWFDGDRMFVYLDDQVTKRVQVEEVVTSIVILRGSAEIPIGQIFHIPVRWLPTRGLDSRETAIIGGQERPIRISLANGVPIKLGIVQGVPGPPGRDGQPGHGGSGRSHIHTQSSPSDEWLVEHGLGYRPLVQVTDTSGALVEGDVQHLSLNAARLRFSAPFAGEARLS